MKNKMIELAITANVLYQRYAPVLAFVILAVGLVGFGMNMEDGGGVNR